MTELEEVLTVKAREKIYRTIDKNPGLHFREIQRRTDLAVGSLQYHLDYLQKQHLIRAEKQGKFIRYYSIRGKQLGEDKEIMSLLRQDSIRKIILFLLQNKRANNLRISNAVGLSPSTTSGYLTKLVEQGVADKRQRGRKSFFYLRESERIAGLLVEYRKSFLDDMVDSFVDIWGGLGK